MGLWGTTLAVLAVACLTVVAVMMFQRSVEKPGGRGTVGSMGDAMSGMIDVFDPGMARSQRDLKEQAAKTEVAPTPDPLDTHGPVQVVHDATGRPAIVRVTDES